MLRGEASPRDPGYHSRISEGDAPREGREPGRHSRASLHPVIFALEASPMCPLERGDGRAEGREAQ